jgi:phage tail sheath protein FI
MATPQLSPGILVREVDLTVGRADNVIDNIGAIAGPFAIGPVEEPIDITTEQELINTFGKPLSTDAQYEYWMSASSYLSYGGILKVVRVDDNNLKNARVGYNTTATVDIKNFDDYNNQETGSYHFAAKTPGTWANGLKVCVIDDKADQIIGINTTDPGNVGARIGFGVTVSLSNVAFAGVGSTSEFSGYLKGIITGVTTNTTGNSSFDVKIVSRVSAAGTETQIDYAQGSQLTSIIAGSNLTFTNNSGISTGVGLYTALTSQDWYDQQTLGLTNSTLFWRSIAPKPVTNQYATSRSAKNDALNIVIIDDTGSLTGVQGNILEKHVSVSKATDSVSGVNSPQKTWYKNYLANFSNYVYSGTNYYTSTDSLNNVVPVVTGFSTYSGVPSASFTPLSISSGGWNQEAQGTTFNAIGNVTFNLTAGSDYSGNGAKATLGALNTAYDLFSNEDEIEVDYLICGPGLETKEDSQAKANKLISIAENRKDCIAVISPYRASIVNVTNTTTQTNNVVDFFSPLSSSSYAIFDSGYKYTYDRFNNLFRYIPCNADIAGLMARTNVTAYPWFSPAGQQRGVLNNAIKLAYNPNKSQRDSLYKARVNSIINQPGTGILLFGDKTALAYASAFDRINVRRLFLTVEQALRRSAEAQLFELNNQTTRANFVNIVEPYLRDVQAKNGVYDFLVVCDTTNNTPDVIDNNEFRADIFLKPTRSINYITLTFVATRTGISFEEVVGRV